MGYLCSPGSDRISGFEPDPDNELNQFDNKVFLLNKIIDCIDFFLKSYSESQSVVMNPDLEI